MVHGQLVFKILLEEMHVAKEKNAQKITKKERSTLLNLEVKQKILLLVHLLNIVAIDQDQIEEEQKNGKTKQRI